MSENHLCECGSGRVKEECCRKIITGTCIASSAEILMRSRYTAYVLADEAYLLATWYPATRPEKLNLARAKVSWRGLSVSKTQAGQSGDHRGVVEFIARYEEAGKMAQVHESSRFIFEQGQWFYVDGDIIGNNKVARNTACPCGSGKKFKRCCGQASNY